MGTMKEGGGEGKNEKMGSVTGDDDKECINERL
jgi:hypothetical protein